MSFNSNEFQSYIFIEKEKVFLVKEDPFPGIFGFLEVLVE
jgi:hypothetical protein